MTRILYIINNLDVGGAERHLLQVLPRLISSDIEPIVYTIGHKGELAPDFEAAGVKVIGAPMVQTLKSWPRILGRPLMMALSSLRLLFVLWTVRPKIVHFFLPHAYIMGGIVSLFAPGLIRVMSRRSLNNYQERYKTTAKIERKLHRRMDAILGNSKKVCEQLRQEGADEQRLGLIYNGLDLSVFEHARTMNDVRHELDLATETLVFVIIANLIPYKGHVDLLNALAMAKTELPEGWRILCVGRDTGIGADLKALARELGLEDHILWLGERRDTVDLLAASDVGFLVSHEEGFSNSILEGMASGLPMIVTDVGGNGEAVKHGETGLVVPPRAPEKLSQALMDLAAHHANRKRFGEAGRARIEDYFSIATCVGRYARFYQALMRLDHGSVQKNIDG